LSGTAEWILLAVFLGTLIAVEFASVPVVEMLLDVGIVMTIIPIAAVAGGRWWPYLIALPVTLLPIAGKTVLQLSRGSLARALCIKKRPSIRRQVGSCTSSCRYRWRQ
jgi:hypothetical protein